jgi:hypothetical protein
MAARQPRRAQSPSSRPQRLVPGPACRRQRINAALQVLVLLTSGQVCSTGTGRFLNRPDQARRQGHLQAAARPRQAGTVLRYHRRDACGLPPITTATLKRMPFKRPTAYVQDQFSLPASISPSHISGLPSGSCQEDPIWFDTHLGSSHAYRCVSSAT